MPHAMRISVDWQATVSVSKTVASMQVIPTPPMRRGAPLHDAVFDAIRNLDTPFIRWMPWGPYPRLQIAELYPPTAAGTSWDFTHIDPELIDFLEATKGRDPIVNFSSVPPWMFESERPVAYPDDPDEQDWSWHRRGALVDPTGKQIAEYYARIVSWYTRGGFTDENGTYHRSGHELELPWWGVLNEYDFLLGPEQYTVVHDAIVRAVREVSPSTRFLSLELAGTAIPGGSDPRFFEYFLDPRNHEPDIPIDMIAYHFYAYPGNDQTPEHWQYTFFDQADTFLAQVRFVEAIRKRLSPETRVYLDELGAMLPDQSDPANDTIPPLYWNASAALYAYLYIELAKLGIDGVGQAGFLLPPGDYPSVTMMDWTTGALNPRHHVVQLLAESFSPGDRLVATSSGGLLASLDDVAAQAFDGERGKRVLLVNKRARAVEVELEGVQSATIDVIDEQSGDDPPRREQVDGASVRLESFAVAVVSAETS